MIISDLNHLEVISETSTIDGGQRNSSYIWQNAYANAGNNSGSGNISIGNVALALNIAVVNQINVSVPSFRYRR